MTGPRKKSLSFGALRNRQSSWSRASYGAWTKPASARRMRIALIDPHVVFRDVLQELSEPKHGFAWARCPFHPDRNPSLCVSVKSGWFECKSTSCGANGRNIVDFVGQLFGYSDRDARDYLERRYG